MLYEYRVNCFENAARYYSCQYAEYRKHGGVADYRHRICQYCGGNKLAEIMTEGTAYTRADKSEWIGFELFEQQPHNEHTYRAAAKAHPEGGEASCNSRKACF